jgi:hypothetical protein
MEFERRAATLELRATGRRLEGYAAVFGQEARIGNFTETIAPAAFSASLSSGKDILALVDHNSGQLLARSKSGTLRLSQDSKGLAFSLDVPKTTLGNDVLALAERGDLGGMSFAFRTPAGGDEWSGNRRTLRSVDLHEISVVQAHPAYAGTTVQARMFVPPKVRLARLFLESL